VILRRPQTDCAVNTVLSTDSAKVSRFAWAVPCSDAGKHDNIEPYYSSIQHKIMFTRRRETITNHKHVDDIVARLQVLYSVTLGREYSSAFYGFTVHA
jgi:hypothetical protein